MAKVIMINFYKGKTMQINSIGLTILGLALLAGSFEINAMQHNAGALVKPKTYAEVRGEFITAKKEGKQEEALTKADLLRECYADSEYQKAELAATKKSLNIKRRLFVFGATVTGFLGSIGLYSLCNGIMNERIPSSAKEIITPVVIASGAMYCIYKVVQYNSKSKQLNTNNVFNDEKKWLTKEIKSIEIEGQPSLLDAKLTKVLQQKRLEKHI